MQLHILAWPSSNPERRIEALNGPISTTSSLQNRYTSEIIRFAPQLLQAKCQPPASGETRGQCSGAPSQTNLPSGPPPRAPVTPHKSCTLAPACRPKGEQEVKAHPPDEMPANMPSQRPGGWEHAKITNACTWIVEIFPGGERGDVTVMGEKFMRMTGTSHDLCFSSPRYRGTCL
jgi:hypothetical protein